MLSFSLWFPSPAFQRFAVRTSKRIEDVSNKGSGSKIILFSYFIDHVNIVSFTLVLYIVAAVQKKQELAEQIKDISKNMDVCSQSYIEEFNIYALTVFIRSSNRKARMCHVMFFKFKFNLHSVFFF